MTFNSKPFESPSRRSSAFCSLAAGLAMGLATLLGAGVAQADVASWVYVGGGATQLQMDGVERESQAALQVDAGFGSNPNRTLVFGGLLRALTHFGGGPDWAMLLRSTSGGFSRGDWGVALDLGGYQRWWGPDSNGFTGTLWAGGPWGLQLGFTAALGSENARTFGLTLGVDWARATAHRQSGQNWWRNYVLPLDRSRE